MVFIEFFFEWFFLFLSEIVERIFWAKLLSEFFERIFWVIFWVIFLSDFFFERFFFCTKVFKRNFLSEFFEWFFLWVIFSLNDIFKRNFLSEFFCNELFEFFENKCLLTIFFREFLCVIDFLLRIFVECFFIFCDYLRDSFIGLFEWSFIDYFGEGFHIERIISLNAFMFSVLSVLIFSFLVIFKVFFFSEVYWIILLK